MSKASNQTYIEQLQSGKIETDKGWIYASLTVRASTKYTLMTDLELPHQTVTARLSELQDLGVVYVLRTIKTTDNKTLSVFAVTTNPERIKLNAGIRKQEKFKKWLKYGEKNFSGHYEINFK